MKTDYVRLATQPLDVGGTFDRPEEPPPLVHLDNSALDVMTDFRQVLAITTRPDLPIDQALELMKRSGVRLLLVVDEAAAVIGLITASDIQGERPIKLAETTRIPRAQIRVEAIMSKAAQVEALNLLTVRNAQVGHVLETLRALERRHLLVIENDPEDGTRIRGLFSASQIAKQLGAHLETDLPTAHSLAKMLHEVAERRGDRAIGELWTEVVVHGETP